MEYKPFLYIGIFCLVYGLFLKNEKEDWKTAKSIVTNVKINDTVINNISGLEISEIQSNADVIYKINDEIHKTNVNVTRNQPLQVGNVIPIQYNANDIKRNEQKIPQPKLWISFGIFLILIASYVYKKTNWDLQDS